MCEKGENKHKQAGWKRWRRVSGYEGVSARINGKDGILDTDREHQGHSTS